jgi:hypothetical protein
MIGAGLAISGIIRPPSQSHSGCFLAVGAGREAAKRPALALFNVIRRKGFQAILQQRQTCRNASENIWRPFSAWERFSGR